MARDALRLITKKARLSVRRPFTFLLFERLAFCEGRAKINFLFLVVLGWTP